MLDRILVLTLAGCVISELAFLFSIGEKEILIVSTT